MACKTSQEGKAAAFNKHLAPFVNSSLDRAVHGRIQVMDQQAPSKVLIQDIAKLEEIVRRTATNHRLACSRTGIKLKEGILEMLINLHNCGLVSTSITIVWS